MSIYSEVRQALRLGTLKVLEQYFPTTEAKDKGIIFSHLNGSEPSIPYVVIQIVQAVQSGRTSYSSAATDVSEELTIINHYRITAQFSFIGTLAGDMAYDFNNAINNNVVMWEAFQKYNLSPVEKSNLRRVPAKRDTKWIEYENLDVVFTYAVKSTQVVDVIEQVILKYPQSENPDTEETLYIPTLTI